MSLRKHVDGLDLLNLEPTLAQELQVSSQRFGLARNIHQAAWAKFANGFQRFRTTSHTRRVQNQRIGVIFHLAKNLFGSALDEGNVIDSISVELSIPYCRRGVFDSYNDRIYVSVIGGNKCTQSSRRAGSSKK